MQRLFRWIPWLLVLMFGCAKSSAPMYEADASKSDSFGAPAAAPAPGNAVGGAVPSMSRDGSPAMSKSGSAAEGASKEEAPAKDDPGSTTSPDVKATRRLIYYNGFARLRATDVDDTRNAVVQLATEAGGFVERLTGSSVTVRVPVDHFEAIFDQVLGLGDVLEKSTTAEDVTDAYTAVDLRLQTARATRDRLVALLARARTEAEKLQLLREIQRVTEEIDRLEAQIKTLASLASFSRITVEISAREALSARSSDEEIAEFRWIQALSPFRRDVSMQGKPLKMTVPEGMVALSANRSFVAESADGAVFWSSRRPNRPEGDTAFWLEALKTRLAPEFATADVQTAGAFQLLRLVDRSDTPYRYLVGVRVDGDELELLEIYFPTEAHEKRYGEAVRASIAKGAL